MIDLPNLLLSYGVELRARGQEYIARCIAHDDGGRPNLSVYRNGDGKWKCHCFSCGFHEGERGVVMHMEGCTASEADIKLGEPTFEGRGKYARIVNDPHAIQEKRKPRVMLTPAADAPVPRMDYLKDRDTGEPYGEPDAYWAFRNAEGIAEVYEARYIFKGKKEPRVFSYGRRGVAGAKWECTHYEGPRPIYARDRIANCQQVAIFEGCRKAERAQALLDAAGASVVACTAWMGGANAWHKSDWSPIHGKPVLLFPDNDAPGHKAMHGLARELSSNVCQVVMVLDDTRPDGWDICDEDWTPDSFVAWAKSHKKEWIDDKATEEQSSGKEDHSQQAPTIEDTDHAPPVIDVPPPNTNPPPIDAYYKDGTSEHAWPTNPINLFDAFAAPKLRPGLLPSIVDDFVFDRAEMMDADPSFGGLACIVTAAGVLDDRIKIRVKHNDTWFESARLWGCLLGEPSTGKTQMQSQATAPLSSLVTKVAGEDAKLAKRQEILDARFEKKWKEYKAAAIESDDHTVPEPFAGQREERLRVKVKSFTMEALEEVLRDCPRGIFCDVDELSGLIGSFDAYRSGSKKDRAQMLEAFNGGPYQKDLIGRGSFTIPNWSASILGTTQPSKLRQLKLSLEDDGFLQRFLVVTSSHIGGSETDRPANVQCIKAWHDLIHNLWEIKHSEYITLSPDAVEARREAMDTISKIVRSGMIGTGFIGHMGKWAGITARMILIFWCIECSMRGKHPESSPVTGECARLAMRYMIEHLLPHAVAFYEDGFAQSEIGEATRNLGGQIVAMNLQTLSTTWLFQHGPGKWRNGGKQLQDDTLNRLVEYGWLAPQSGINSATRRPTKFAVNPNVHAMFAGYQEREMQQLIEAREIGALIRAGG